jgi:hypothetical protein
MDLLRDARSSSSGFPANQSHHNAMQRVCGGVDSFEAAAGHSYHSSLSISRQRSQPKETTVTMHRCNEALAGRNRKEEAA